MPIRYRFLTPLPAALFHDRDVLTLRQDRLRRFVGQIAQLRDLSEKSAHSVLSRVPALEILESSRCERHPVGNRRQELASAPADAFRRESAVLARPCAWRQ